MCFAGSNCSSSSEGETTPTALHAGICVRQQSVSIKDAIIAREALSLLVTCLQLRCQQLCKTPAGVQTHYKITVSLLLCIAIRYSVLCPTGSKSCVWFLSPASFYNLPSVNDFIIDILLGSPSGEVKKTHSANNGRTVFQTLYYIYLSFLCFFFSQIRRVACDQLYTLSQTDTSAFPEVQKPNLFLLSVILTAQLPLWSPTSVMRGVNQRYLINKVQGAKSLKHMQTS